jgi:hypothetical protein
VCKRQPFIGRQGFFSVILRFELRAFTFARQVLYLLSHSTSHQPFIGFRVGKTNNSLHLPRKPFQVRTRGPRLIHDV